MERQRSRGRTRQLGRLERDILDQLTAGDLLIAFLLSGRSTKRLRQLAYQRANERYRRKLAIERLRHDGYVDVRRGKLHITSAGQRALTSMADRNRRTLHTQTWDYKWRIASFDIPEKYASLRKRVRSVLKRAGFVRLQNSVWIFPHECEELVRLIKEDERLAPYVLYGVLEKIEGEERLRKLFRI